MLSMRRSNSKKSIMSILEVAVDSANLINLTQKFDEYISQLENIQQTRDDWEQFVAVKEYNTRLILAYVGTFTHDAASVFSDIDASHFLLKPKDQISINNATRVSNEQSGYVKYSILSQSDHASRQIMLERWIMIAMILHQTGNFFSAQAVFLGLMQHEVCRLFDVNNEWHGLTPVAGVSLKFLAAHYELTKVAIDARREAILCFKGAKLPTLDILTKKIQGEFTGAMDNLNMHADLLREQIKSYENKPPVQELTRSLTKSILRRSVVSKAPTLDELKLQLAVVEAKLESLKTREAEYVTKTFASLYIPADKPVPVHLKSPVLLRLMHDESIHSHETTTKLRSASYDYQPKDKTIHTHAAITLLDDMLVPLVVGEFQGHSPLWQIQLLARLTWILSPDVCDLWGDKLDVSVVNKINKLYRCLTNDALDESQKCIKITKYLKHDFAVSQLDSASNGKQKFFSVRLSGVHNPSVSFLAEVYSVLSEGGGVRYRDCLERLDRFTAELSVAQRSEHVIRYSQ